MALVSGRGSDIRGEGPYAPGRGLSFGPRAPTGAEADPLRALWRLAIAAGLRQGELAALRWPDFDLDGGAVSVTGALEQRTGRPPRRAETKTERSRRTVPLDAATVAALREHRARAIEADLAAGKSYDLNGWVFRRTRGDGPLTMSIIWKAWRRLAVRASVPSSVSTTYATRLRR